MVLAMHLDLLADYLNVEVVDGTPSDDRWGEFDEETRTITLLHRLAPIQRTCTLAHELAHAVYRHRGCRDSQERQADEYAWWLTIPLCSFLEAASAHETVEAVADELGVMPDMVEGYWRRGKAVCDRN